MFINKRECVIMDLLYYVTWTQAFDIASLNGLSSFVRLKFWISNTLLVFTVLLVQNIWNCI